MKSTGLMIVITFVFFSYGWSTMTRNNCTMVNEEHMAISLHCPSFFKNRDLESIPNGTLYLQLHFERLETLGELFFDDIKSLKKSLLIQGKMLKSIKQNAFAHFTNLQKLTITSTVLRDLPGNLFKDLKSLRTLNITGNKDLKVIDDFAFTGLEFLNTLCLVENGIELLNHNIFGNLSNIERLDLSKNRLMSIDNKTFSKFSKLVKLILDDNHLISIPDYSFLTLAKLTYLSLQNNVLTQISRHLFTGLKSIRKIFLGQNKINQISNHSIYDLQKLNYLDLSKNKLTHFGNISSYNLKEILRLNLSNNYLRVLKRNMMLSSTLRIFDASNNQLENIDEDAFKGLSKLNVISLRNCNLTYLPPNLFSNLSMLVKLDLSNNNLESFNSSILFRDLRRLYYLFLNGNNGFSINEYPQLTNIYVLNIADMNLRTIPYKALIGFKRLGDLQIQNNKIKDIDVTQFCAIRRFRRINASGNMLTTLNPDWFLCLPDLIRQTAGRYVDIRNNPIQCTLYFMEVYQILVSIFPIKANCVLKSKKIDAALLDQVDFTKNRTHHNLDTENSDQLIDTFPQQYCIVLKFKFNISGYNTHGRIEFVENHGDKNTILSIKIKSHLEICFNDFDASFSCIRVGRLRKDWNWLEIYQQSNDDNSNGYGNTCVNFVLVVNGEVLKNIEKVRMRYYQDIGLILEKSDDLVIQKFVLYTDQSFKMKTKEKDVTSFKKTLFLGAFLSVSAFIIIWEICQL